MADPSVIILRGRAVDVNLTTVKAKVAAVLHRSVGKTPL